MWRTQGKRERERSGGKGESQAGWGSGDLNRDLQQTRSKTNDDVLDVLNCEHSADGAADPNIRQVGPTKCEKAVPHPAICRQCIHHHLDPHPQLNKRHHQQSLLGFVALDSSSAFDLCRVSCSSASDSSASSSSSSSLARLLL
jgi:hypothetical protein